ncbi:MAG: efflux RND transporter permease subunit [Candidatus Latescibacteria bacterium]|nr:efflux RND transporter permease subunit [Candidatus Latescibacterota bacterium]
MIRGAVARPVAVLMVFAGLLVVGVQSYRRLPVDLLPSINYPNLTVITEYPEVPADDLARLVTQPLEERITGLAGVRQVVSRTREGASTVTVQYEWGTAMDFANLHLREAVDQVSNREDFPDGADRPLILRWDPSARPVAIMVLEGDDDMAEMTQFCEEVVKPALEQVDGISQAEVIGGREREILVRPDPDKLRLYGLSMADLRQALALSNVSFPGGRVRKGPLHLPLRILGEFESLDDIRRTEIPTRRAGLITVGDVAEVLDTVKEPEGLTLINGRETVSLLLYKEVGANTIRATAEVDRILEVLRGQYPDFESRFVYRDADFVQESFRGLTGSLLSGAALAFLVLFFFLREWRSPIVVCLSMPVSIITAFAFMHAFKVNINLMSLGGLSLAAGMLVDNSIVVLDNIKRHLAEDAPGASVAATCASATREVAMPVLASTLTTVAVFFPVIYVPGIAGEFFRDQAITVTIALLVSVATALLLQPTLSARMLKAGHEHPRGVFRFGDALFERAYRVYHAGLVKVMNRKGPFYAWLALGTAAAVVVALGLPRSFLPERSTGDFTLALELPSGTPLEATGVTAAALAGDLAAMPEVATVFSQVGQTERTLAALKDYTAANTVRLRVLLHPARDGAERMARVKDRLRPQLARLAGAVATYHDEGIGLQEILASGEAPFNLGVVAEHAEDAVSVADELMRRLPGVPGLVDLEMDRVLGNPSVEVSIDREDALRHGLDPDTLARELQARVQGVVATTFNEVEQRIDIAVRLPLERRRDLDGVLASPVRVGEGLTVPLGNFTDLSEGRPVREVVRRDQRRQITLSGDVQGRSLSRVWQDVQREIAGLDLPAGVGFVQGGEQEEITSSFRDLGWALLLSALLVYMILAAQFESFVDPLIITTVLPVGVLGAGLACAISGQTVNIISLIGLVALLGIDVNDAIVKVSAIRQLREEGMSGRAAVLEAGRLRFRPIMMTNLTTVLGLIPMAIGLGTGAQVQRPLAITILGGLTISTVVMLFLTPTLYEIVHRRLDRDYEGKAGA